MSVWGFGMSQEWRRIVAPVVAEGWTEPRKTRITLVLPSALSIEWSGPRLYRVTGQAELGMLLCVADTPDGTPGDRVLVEHKVYERLLTRLDAPRSYFFVHPCGLPIWRDPAGGLTFSTKFTPIARCPQCNDEIRLDDCAPLANGPAAFTIEVGPAFDEAVFQRMATVATLTSAVPRRFRVEATVGPWMAVFLARQKGVQRTALEGYGLAAPLREAA